MYMSQHSLAVWAQDAHRRGFEIAKRIGSDLGNGALNRKISGFGSVPETVCPSDNRELPAIITFIINPSRYIPYKKAASELVSAVGWQVWLSLSQ